MCITVAQRSAGFNNQLLRPAGWLRGQPIGRRLTLYFAPVRRTYVRVVLLEAAIVIALVILGRLFS
jgi:hypothetical protein